MMELIYGYKLSIKTASNISDVITSNPKKKSQHILKNNYVEKRTYKENKWSGERNTWKKIQKSAPTSPLEYSKV